MIHASESAQVPAELACVSWPICSWVKSVTLTLGTACLGLEVSKAFISQNFPRGPSGGTQVEIAAVPKGLPWL